MKIEKLAETKLKIIFNSEELEENNISLHSFLSNSVETQKFFMAILEIANEDLDFNFCNCNITYELFSLKNKTFIIFITKSPSDTENNISTTDTFFPVLKDKIFSNESRFFFKNNKLTKIKTSCIFSFYSIEELFDFCNILKNSNLPLNLESTLYKYNQLYFLEIKINPNKPSSTDSLELINLICSDIKEESLFAENTIIKLKEFSEVLLEKNAISILG